MAPRNSLAARLLALWTWLPRALRAIDEGAAQQRAGLPAEHYDARVPQVLLVAAAVLAAQWYWGDRPFFYELWGRRLERGPLAHYAELLAFSWWSGTKLLGFLILPCLHVRLLGGRLRDWGLGRGRGFLRVYLLLYLAMLPVLLLVSRSPAFLATYPLYQQARRSALDLVLWELQYGLVFLSVEFFFRGYLLFGLERALGSHAIFVSMVPYCMLHALKPAAESYGSIVAGVVLGALALRTRSIWFGVLLHVSVAWTMDLLAILRR